MAEDPNVRAVKSLTSGYPGNTNFTVPRSLGIGAGKIFVVSFKGQDGNWYEHFVLENGKTRTPYQTLEQLMSNWATNGLIPQQQVRDHEHTRLVMAYSLIIIFLLPIIYLLVQQPDSKNIQWLGSIVLILIGYVVGRKL